MANGKIRVRLRAFDVELIDQRAGCSESGCKGFRPDSASDKNQ